MREHLFRGKRADGKWVEGSLVKDSQQTFIRDFGYEYHEVMTFTVQEYTGKNIRESNQKIFEGDVIRMKSLISSDEHYIVTWNQGKCSFELREYYKAHLRFDMEILDIISDAKIIGNVTEPAEDLK